MSLSGYSLPQQRRSHRGGRPPTLWDSELLTVLIWDGLCEPRKNLSAVYTWIEREYSDYFPHLPKYQNFASHIHHLMPQMVWLLQSLLAHGAPPRFADSTMLPVCKPIRADRHRAVKGVAQFGKNWQGWHYGFKLHAAIDHNNRLAALVFTPANEHDNQVMKRLVNACTRVLVGDSHYGGSVMRKRLWRRYKTVVIAPPHHTQRKSFPTIGRCYCYACGRRLRQHSASSKNNASWSLRSREVYRATLRTTCVPSWATR